MLGLMVLPFARADVWVPAKSGRGLGYQTESAWEVGGLVTRDFGHRPCLPPQGRVPGPSALCSGCGGASRIHARFDLSEFIGNLWDLVRLRR